MKLGALDWFGSGRKFWVVAFCLLAKIGGWAADGISLPSEAIEKWKAQTAAMSAALFEFTETNSGTVTNWDFTVLIEYRAYFDQGSFYVREHFPGREGYDEDIAFDAKSVWRRNRWLLRERPVEEPVERYPRLVMLPYLNAAGVYAPEYSSELKQFRTIQPLPLYYLSAGASNQVEQAGENFRVSFWVADAFAHMQFDALHGKPDEMPDPDRSIPPRKIVFLIDPKREYAVTAREDWNIEGRLVGRTKCEDWRFFADQNIWLPQRCIVSSYARPRLFISEYASEPVHVATLELKRAEFGKQPIACTFASAATRTNNIFHRSQTNSFSVTAKEVDRAIVERIEKEVLENSQVMTFASWLTDVYGPRLTGSPNLNAAIDWAATTMRNLGLEVRLEACGTFSRGWQNERLTFRATAPQNFTVQAAPIPWSPGTAGIVSGPAVRFDLHSRADLKRFAGKIKNAFLLMDEPLPPTGPRFEADAKRSSDARLAELAAPQPPRDLENELEHERYTDRFLNDPASVAWLMKEDVAAVLFVAPGDYGTIVLAGNGSVSLDQTNQTIPFLKVSAESYGRIARLLEKQMPVMLDLEMQNRVTEQPGLTNLIVEIPGVDPRLKDEVVMAGAHIDSWAFGTGATDNACNVATIMEALRILKALDLKPRRTIRAGFWTHEEQGARGSSAYVDQHFVSGPTAAFEKGNFSVYFNMDMGAGKVRGLVRVPTADAKAIFAEWMKPYHELGANTVSPWEIGGGDDGSFIRAGLPSFGFLQDPLDYNTRTHHTSSDVYERIPPDDARFNSAFVAHFLWCAAQRDGKFPR